MGALAFFNVEVGVLNSNLGSGPEVAAGTSLVLRAGDENWNDMEGSLA